jgi:hypothetical protein
MHAFLLYAATSSDKSWVIYIIAVLLTMHMSQYNSLQDKYV